MTIKYAKLPEFRKLTQEIAVLSGGRLALRGEAAQVSDAELDRAYRGDVAARAEDGAP